MCGIAGVWDNSSVDIDNIRRMTDALSHRGPDHRGVWVDEHSSLFLGHARLAILDAEPTANQPMLSSCGRFALTYNGELYNFKKIEQLIKKRDPYYQPKTRSDTEILLKSLAILGIDETLREANGMFAFAVWDRLEQKLYFAIDRFGEKPLYFGVIAGQLLFASELKSLKKHRLWASAIDRNALAAFMRNNHIPAPRTIYLGVQKLKPGTYITVTKEHGDFKTAETQYWNMGDVVRSNIKNRSPRATELIDELDLLLRESVRLRMLSDVPIGAFLSGGIDSTAVVAQMQMLSSKPVQTFSIGTSAAYLDEAKHSAKIARHLGADHSELYISERDVVSLVPKLPYIYDEPFADSSQLPTILVCQLAKQNATVVLGGDGGDELFAGYNRHITGPKLWSLISRLSETRRKILWNVWGESAATLMSKVVGRYKASKLDKLMRALGAQDRMAFYELLKVHWRDDGLVLGASQEALENSSVPPSLSTIDLFQYLDINSYLPGDILTKVDRASMSQSLEVRLPFLDKDVFEFAWRVPEELKVKAGIGKQLLRKVTYRYVPEALMDRPKMGFAIPLGAWLRGPLREWSENLLDHSTLSQQGFLQPSLVAREWKQVKSGNDFSSANIWCVLMFQAWLDEN